MLLLSLISAADPVFWYLFVKGDPVGLPAAVLSVLWVCLCAVYIPVCCRRWSGADGTSGARTLLFTAAEVLLFAACIPLAVLMVGKGHLWGALIPVVRAGLAVWAYRRGA